MRRAGYVWWLFFCVPVASAQEVDSLALWQEQVVTLYQAGRYDEAIRPARRVVEVLREREGPEAPDYLAAAGNLVLLYVQRDRFAEAEPWQAERVTAYHRVAGDTARVTLTARSDLAYIHHQLGRFDEAEAGYRAVAEGWKTVRGDTSLAYAGALEDLAELLEDRSRYDEAVATYEQALAIRALDPDADPEARAETLNLLGRLFRRMGRLEDAEARYVESLALRQAHLGPEHPDVLESQNNLAVVYQFTGRWAAAESLLVAVADAEARTLGRDSNRYLKTLNNLAALYRNRARYPAAESLLVEVLQTRRRVLGPAHGDVAISMNNLAALYVELSRYAEAERLYTGGLEILRQNPATRVDDYATGLANVASLYRKTGRYEASEELYRQVLSLRKWVFGEGHPEVAASLNSLGLLYDDTGRYAEAETLLLQALRLRKAAFGTEHPAYAESLDNLGVLYYHQGRFEEAERVYRQALALREGTPDADYAHSVNNLGALYLELARYEEAADFFGRGLAIMRRLHGERHPLVATSLNNLASAEARLGRMTDAADHLSEALTIWRDVLGPHHPDYAKGLNNAATLYVRVGRPAEAEPWMRQALAVRREALGEDHPDVAQSLNNLAMIYAVQGRFADAAPLFEESLAHRRRVLGPDHPDVAAGLVNLSVAYAAIGRPGEAYRAVSEGIELEDRTTEEVFRFSSEAEMRAYLAETKASVEVLAQLALGGAVAGAAEALRHVVLRRKGQILEALMRYRTLQDLMASDSLVSARVNATRGLRQAIADLQLHPPPDVAYDRVLAYSDSLRGVLAGMEQGLHRLLTERGAAGKAAVPSQDALPERLPDGAVLVEYAVVNLRTPGWERGPLENGVPHYLAFVVPRVGTPALVDLGPAAAIDRLVADYREAMELARRDFRRGEEEAYLEEEIQAAGADLYEVVLAPLALGKPARLYVAPDGELNRIPFAALVDGAGRYLIDTMPVVYLNTGRDLMRPPAAPGTGSVIFAGPDFDLGASARAAVSDSLRLRERGGGLRSRGAGALVWKPLPGAAAEADDFQAALDATAYGPVMRFEGRTALEEAFKSLHAPRILHVATHGFFLEDQHVEEASAMTLRADEAGGAALGRARLQRTENPLLRSGLILAGANALTEGTAFVEDGWLTAEEIGLLDLKGTDLVVLSACETGLGDVRTGEGVYGLRRAFTFAGARTLVMSLFQVPDRETRALMRAFYRRLAGGEGRLMALVGAQREMIERRRHTSGAAHPFFWASFILVGEAD